MALRAERCGAHKREHFLHAAQYVSFVGGLEAAAGQRVLDTARQLEALPQLRKDFAAGLISQTKVELVAAVAGVDAGSVEDLIDLAGQDSVTALKREANRRKAAAAAPQRC